MTGSGLGCVETAADEDLIGSFVGIFEFGGYLRFLGLFGRPDGGFGRISASGGVNRRQRARFRPGLPPSAA